MKDDRVSLVKILLHLKVLSIIHNFLIIDKDEGVEYFTSKDIYEDNLEDYNKLNLLIN